MECNDAINRNTAVTRGWRSTFISLIFQGMNIVRISSLFVAYTATSWTDIFLYNLDLLKRRFKRVLRSLFEKAVATEMKRINTNTFWLRWRLRLSVYSCLKKTVWNGTLRRRWTTDLCSFVRKLPSNDIMHLHRKGNEKHANVSASFHLLPPRFSTISADHFPRE